MKTAACSTHRFDIVMAGDYANAEQVCREYCLAVGLCVTIEPVEYVYTGGQESGFRVGLMNYPRFPTSEIDLRTKAHALAELLRERLCQHSFSIIGRDVTEWSTRRES